MKVKIIINNKFFKEFDQFPISIGRRDDNDLIINGLLNLPTDLERLYATVVAQTPEGEEPPTVQEFLLSQKEGSSDLSFAELSQLTPVILASLQTKFGKDDVELSDFAVQRGQDEDGEDIFVPLNIAIEDVRTNDDIRKLIKDSVLNPNAKQETGRTFFR